MGAFLFRRFCPCGQCHHQKACKHNHMAAPVKAARQHTLSGTLRNLPEVASGTYTSTHRNPPHPEPASGTYTSTHRNLPEPSGTFRNLPEPVSGNYTGTLWNLPEVASGTYTSTRRNPPEPSGTCLRNLHQHTPEPSGTFRNLPPEPTPAHTGTFRNLLPELTPAHTRTLRNLPEPNPPEPFSSGTCSWGPHRHTPERIWAEDPMSLRCWGKTSKNNLKKAWNNFPGPQIKFRGTGCWSRTVPSSFHPHRSTSKGRQRCLAWLFKSSNVVTKMHSSF